MKRTRASEGSDVVLDTLKGTNAASQLTDEQLHLLLPSEGSEVAEPSPAQNFLAAFSARDRGYRVQGLLGRFIRGVDQEQLSKLSDEPGKLLSWVSAEELLQSVLGNGPAAAMAQVGFALDWIKARLDDGTKFRLVVFPASGNDRTLATWDGLFELVCVCHGSEVADRLAPHMPDLKQTEYEAIDPDGRLREISNLPVAEKMSHPEYMTAERFLKSIDDEVTLYDARAFFYHAIGCNSLFRGDGTNYKGKAEYVTLNRRLSEIPGVCWLDLEVTLSEIDELLARKLPEVTGVRLVGSAQCSQ